MYSITVFNTRMCSSTVFGSHVSHTIFGLVGDQVFHIWREELCRSTGMVQGR